MKRSIRALIILAMMTLSSFSARAQLGAELGASYNIENGSYIAPCGCTFAHGVGYGFFGAASFDLVKLAGFTFGIKAGAEQQRFTSAESVPDGLAKIANGDQEEIALTYITFDPYARYTIRPLGLFVQVSPSIGYLASKKFHHAAGTAVEEGEAEPAIDPDTTMELRSARYLARLGAGYEIELAGLTLAPMISAGIPLTDLTLLNAKDWRVTTIYLSLAAFF
jgi:hypothetical protein